MDFCIIPFNRFQAFDYRQKFHPVICGKGKSARHFLLG
jgi:hypothetical protein